MFFIELLIGPLSLIIAALLSVALITLIERKAMAASQVRMGPNVVGYVGLLQPFADALKLIIKETVSIIASNGYLFLFSPLMIFCLSLTAWGIMTFDAIDVIYDFPLNSLVIALTTSLAGQYILISGWSSGSKYALLGALRAAAQFISYEMFISLALLNVTLYYQTLNINEIILNQENDSYNLISLYFAFLFFFVAIMAEANRPPFDLPEAEGELVAGYHVEYASLPFAFFYISEYANVFFNSIIANFVFIFIPMQQVYFINEQFDLGGLAWVTAVGLVLIQIWIRASFPRYLIDYIMEIGWKFALYVNLAMIFFIINLEFFISLL